MQTQKNSWLPTTVKEAKQRNWNSFDVVLFTGDAYVDHPAFGTAVIGRILEAEGLKVAIVPQPNWQDDLRDFKKFGIPKYFFAVTSGCMDSMVNHYTANKRLRSDDAYTPGGKAGFRPDYALTVYSSILKKLFPEVPIVIGGIEASLRRFTHYDYWSDRLKAPILEETGADFLIYGMGEKPIKELITRLKKGEKLNEIKNLPQTGFISAQITNDAEALQLYSHNDCLKSKQKFAENFRIIEQESNKLCSKKLIQPIKNSRFLIVNAPYPTLSTHELDAVYELPFTYLPHPKYNKKPAIPAYDMIKNSITIHRGCFGGCSFCTISAHQGKFISSRSEKSITNEIEKLKQLPNFKGILTDLGGPSANMYQMQAFDHEKCLKCKRPSCCFPTVCPNLDTNHQPLIDLYKKVEKINGIRKIFIGSGVRYDLLFDKNNEIKGTNRDYAKRLITKHVSGRLKVAPEHTSVRVLKTMRKPTFSQFKKFKQLFDATNRQADLRQQLIPYFISSHPQSTLSAMTDLALETKKLNYRLEQIQDFTPTPMTLATVMYYTELDPYTMKKIYVAKSKEQKLEQRLLFFWYKRENQQKIKSLLSRIKRQDAIGELLTFPNKKTRK